MQKIEANYDISFWNVDMLSLRTGYQAKGKIKMLPMNFVSDIDAALFIACGRIVVFSGKNRSIFLLDPYSGKHTKSFSLDSDMEWTDIAVKNNDIYALNKNKRIDHLRFDNRQMKYFHSGSKEIECSSINEYTRIALGDQQKPDPVFPKRMNKTTVAYIGPFEKSRFLAVYLEDDYKEQAELKVAMPKEYPDKHVGNNIRFFADDKNNSLIIAEKDKHRVFEYYIKSGESIHICGNAAPSSCMEGETAKKAGLNNPMGVAVYRPQEFIEKGFFSETAKNILSCDRDGVLPRFIFICDHGNDCVRKIMEYPESVGALKVSGLNMIFTLMGGAKNKDNAYLSEDKDSLPAYDVPNPVNVSVSPKGEIIILNDRGLYFLQPATSIGEYDNYKESTRTSTDAS